MKKRDNINHSGIPEVLLENSSMGALLKRIRKYGHEVIMQIEGDPRLYLISFY